MSIVVIVITVRTSSSISKNSGTVSTTDIMVDGAVDGGRGGRCGGKR